MAARSQIVENLQIQLGASIDKAMGQTLAKWERDNLSAAGKAAASFKSFDAAVGKAHTSLLSFRNLAVVGLVTGAAALVTRMLSAADAIQDSAEAAGLSTTRYQELRFAFQFAGVSADSFGAAMSRFAKNVGEASQGNDDLIDTFKRLGVSIYDVNGNLRTQDAILNDTVKGLSGIRDQAVRSAEAYALFGREAGSKFAAAIGQGEAAIDALVQKARDMNLILDEETVKAAAAAADQIDTLGQVIGVRLTAAIAKAAPGIQMIVNAIAWLLEPFDFGQGQSPLDQAAEKLGRLQRQADAIGESGGGTQQWFKDRFGMDLGAERQKVEQQRRGVAGGMELGAMGRAPGITILPPGAGSLDLMVGKSASSRAKADADKWLAVQSEAYDAGMDLMRQNIEAEDALELQQLDRRMRALDAIERQKYEARKAYQEATDDIIVERREKERDAAEAFRRDWTGVLSHVANTMEDVLLDKSLSTWDKIKRIALAAIFEIAQQQIAALGGGSSSQSGWVTAAKIGYAAIAAYFGTGGGTGGSSTVPAGGVHGPTTGGAYAEGGVMPAGRWSMVGERGPEPVFPAVAGRVISHEDAMRALGGTGGRGGGQSAVNQTFVFNVGTGASEAAMVVRGLLPQITAAAKAGVADDYRRNRGVARA